MMRAETVGSEIPVSLAGALVVVDSFKSRLDELLAENDRLRAKLADATAEKDNILPTLERTQEAQRLLLDVTENYKKQADDFEFKYDCSVAECEELRTRVGELEDQLADVKDTHGWDLNA